MQAFELGLCGWNGSQSSYFANFGCIEIQSTFYEPPATTRTAAKWRADAPDNFHFCIKAWQLITHTPKSPTYRRLKSPVAAHEQENLGSFRPTEQVWRAWERTRDIAEALDARVIVFQCPKSFLPNSENLQNFAAFFRRVKRGPVLLAWEPRGEAWTQDVVRELCMEFELLHCVDPFLSTSLHGPVTYWRLHGRGAYSYRYTDRDLEILKTMLLQQAQPTFVMFNNFSSKPDALRFRQLL